MSCWNKKNLTDKWCVGTSVEEVFKSNNFYIYNNIDVKYLLQFFLVLNKYISVSFDKLKDFLHNKRLLTVKHFYSFISPL